MRRGPRIEVVYDSVVITAIIGEKGKGKDGDLMAWRSRDSAIPWLGPTQVNDMAGSAREGLHGMTSDDNGNLWCVWLDSRSRNTEVFCSKSDDLGSTWGINRLVYRSPDGNVCECCHPSVAVNKEKLCVLFRNLLGGDRDMYTATSADDGTTFPEVTKLGRENKSLKGCPMDGGMIAFGANGSVATIWQRKGAIYGTIDGTPKEMRIGSGPQPWLAAAGDRTVAVWTVFRDGELLAQDIGSKKRIKLGT